MRRVSFCCSTSRGTVLDRRVADVKSLFEARQYAAAVARSLIANTATQDWRRCRLHVRDEQGEELFVMPFWSMTDRPGLTTRLRAALGRAWPWRQSQKPLQDGDRIETLRPGVNARHRRLPD